MNMEDEGMVDTTNANPEEIASLLDAIEEVNNNGMLPEGVQFNLSTTMTSVVEEESRNYDSDNFNNSNNINNTSEFNSQLTIQEAEGERDEEEEEAMN